MGRHLLLLRRQHVGFPQRSVLNHFLQLVGLCTLRILAYLFFNFLPVTVLGGSTKKNVQKVITEYGK